MNLNKQYPKEYAAWSSMKQRCYNTKNREFKRYGERGIQVDQRWLIFENFINDLGPAPSKDHQLDRERVNEGYGPDNCRWVLREVQVRNRRTNRWIDFNGEKMCIKDASDLLGITRGSFTIRRNTHNWTDQQTFNFYLENGPQAKTTGQKVMLNNTTMYTSNAIQILNVTPWLFYKYKRILKYTNQQMVDYIIGGGILI